MKSKLILGIGSFALIGLLAFGTWYLIGGHQPRRIKYNPAYDAYLSGFTSGDISKSAQVLIRFQNEVSTDTGHLLDKSPISFSPRLRGTTRWVDTRTLAFAPEKELTPGEIYTGTLDLKNIIGDIPRSLRFFEFQFRCMPRKINVSPVATHTWNSPEGQFAQLAGYITTTDHENSDYVQKILVAKRGNNTLPVKWTHSDDGKTHHYTVDSLRRTDTEYNVRFNWVEDHSAQQKLIATVPAANDFRVLKIEKYDNEGDKYIIIEFTDPIDRNQNLEGLIRVNDHPVRFLTEGNRVKVFTNRNVLGQLEVRVENGVLNTQGKPLNQPFTQQLTFDALKPALKLVGKGVVMPRGETLPFIFEAACLKAVDVRVIKVFERSVPQFLQVNTLNGYNEMRRVGKILVNKRIDLDKTPDLDLKAWNYHSIDLSSLINLEPGAIYEVVIGFRKSYTLWEGCVAEAAELDEEGRPMAPVGETEREMLAMDEEEWESGNGYVYHGYYDDYYEEGGEPCDEWYYNSDRAIRRNVLASDLGLIAKQGAGGSFFAVTNLKTTEPISGVELELLDYQLQVLGKYKTDKLGQVFVKMERRPFLLVAKMGDQRGYLRLDDATALSLSRYDVQGQSYQKGLKGFIYGERGVWRPGDEMFINFILEDEYKTLPPNHPVTFELVGPRGQVVQKITKTQGLNGFYNFTCRTQPDAFTGNYLARVRVGGAVFEKTIKVETILPNRMKLDLNFGTELLTLADNGRKGQLTVNWLHGAPGKALKADAKVIIAPQQTVFKKFPNFCFDDLTRDFEYSEKTIFEGNLDDNGKANVPFDVKVSGSPAGMLKAIFRVRAFEPGGNFSIDRFSIPFSPYSEYAGMQTAKGMDYEMVKPNQDNLLRIAAVDARGNPLSGKNINVALYKLDWRWWFDREDESGYSYRQSLNREPVANAQVTTGADGTAQWSYKLNEWGRFLVRVTNEAGHSSSRIVYVDWPYWDQVEGGNGGGPAFLAVNADKETYQVGQNATISIPSPNGGRALVTVETGNRVLRADWVDTKQGVTTFSFPVTSEMCPNSYVTVSLLQPHAQTANDLPIRMYGLTALMVEDPASKLEPNIVVAEKLEPGKEFTVKVGEKRGGPMTYTLAVVDEGLLGLTRFKTPDPWDYFFQREALSVKTWDIFDYVLGAFKGEIKSLLSIGGDAGLINADKPDRFKPVVLYAGPFELKKGETRSHTLKMPNYIGEVRVMVIAGNNAGAYGAAEKSVKVKQPLMVLATLPRVAGPNEEISLPITVFASEKGINNVNVNVSASGLLEIGAGGVSRTLNFNGEEGEEMVSLNLKTKPQIGTGNVKITVTNGTHTAIYETNLTVRVANPRITDVASSRVEPGQNWSVPYKPVGMPGTNKATFELSSVPPLNLASRTQYLITYPYGCIEQTTSGALAQLYLPSLIDLTAVQKESVEKNIKAAIDRLFNSFSTSSGGFAYWPGESNPSEWGSTYAGHFLAEAKRIGYAVNEEMLKKWSAYQKKMANNWTEAGSSRQTELQQAYRLYVLALHGQAEMGAMNRMRAMKNNYATARWLLAASYHLAGQQDVARKLTDKLSKQAERYRELSDTYGSKLRDESLMLMCCGTMTRREEGDVLLAGVSDEFSKDDWLSTHETGMGLLAISRYIGVENRAGKKTTFSYRIGNGAWTDVSFDKPFKMIELPNPDQATTIEFRNSSVSLAFPRLVSEGIPLEGDGTSASNNLSIKVEYLTTNGKSINLSKLTQGTDFAAWITVTNPTGRYYKEMVINQIFPSGWEIHNARMDGVEGGGEAARYQDIRDDRVYTFFDLPPNGTKKFRIMLNAAYLGRFYLPTAYAEAMYDHTINARVGGQWTEIVVKGAN